MLDQIIRYISESVNYTFSGGGVVYDPISTDDVAYYDGRGETHQGSYMEADDEGRFYWIEWINGYDYADPECVGTYADIEKAVANFVFTSPEEKDQMLATYQAFQAKQKRRQDRLNLLGWLRAEKFLLWLGYRKWERIGEDADLLFADRILSVSSDKDGTPVVAIFATLDPL